ncbi:MAG: YraN family protein [Phycisphaerae bacterium]
MVWPFRRSGRKRQAPSSPPAGADDDKALGSLGEKLAWKLLKGKRYKLLARNYRCPSGEADLIALDVSTLKTTGAETIVFVEVKTRRSDRYTSPAAAVDDGKQARLRRVAAYYRRGRDTTGFAFRFDVVSIVAADGQEPRVEHIVGAFT